MSDEPIKKLTDLIGLSQKEILKNQLRILEGLMAQAIKDKDWTGAMKIFQESSKLLKLANRL